MIAKSELEEAIKLTKSRKVNDVRLPVEVAEALVRDIDIMEERLESALGEVSKAVERDGYE